PSSIHACTRAGAASTLRTTMLPSRSASLTTTRERDSDVLAMTGIAAAISTAIINFSRAPRPIMALLSGRSSVLYPDFHRRDDIARGHRAVQLPDPRPHRNIDIGRARRQVHQRLAADEMRGDVVVSIPYL